MIHASVEIITISLLSSYVYMENRKLHAKIEQLEQILSKYDEVFTKLNKKIDMIAQQSSIKEIFGIIPQNIPQNIHQNIHQKKRPTPPPMAVVEEIIEEDEDDEEEEEEVEDLDLELNDELSKLA